MNNYIYIVVERSWEARNVTFKLIFAIIGIENICLCAIGNDIKPSNCVNFDPFTLYYTDNRNFNSIKMRVVELIVNVVLTPKAI